MLTNTEPINKRGSRHSRQDRELLREVREHGRAVDQIATELGADEPDEQEEPQEEAVQEAKEVTQEKRVKQYDIVIDEQRTNGGRIIISTALPDRDRDRVMSRGARIEDYMRNPVVQFGHNYRDPWATIGRTNDLQVGNDTIVSDFDLRPAANEHDPQNIVLLLWNGNWIRTASIGFLPAEWQENELGGFDFLVWILTEWSIVPVPANQGALRLAAKALGTEEQAALKTILSPQATVKETEAGLSVVESTPVASPETQEELSQDVIDALAEALTHLVHNL